MKKEDPAFALVAGDLIMGHWGTKREKIDEWANKYYPGWGQRFKDHDLKVYAALGDGVHSLNFGPATSRAAISSKNHFNASPYYVFCQSSGSAGNTASRQKILPLTRLAGSPNSFFAQ
jgi:hypothetical protein